MSQRRICSDNFTCCHTEIEVADPTFYLTRSQYTDTGPTSPSADPITPGAWQGSHWSANFWVTGMTRPPKKSRRKRESNPGSSSLEADALTTWPTRRFLRRTAQGQRGGGRLDAKQPRYCNSCAQNVICFLFLLLLVVLQCEVSPALRM